MAKTMSTLRQVRIEIGGKMVTAWEPKDPALHLLGRWTDPQALLRRIHELQHPEEAELADGRGRQWQSTWRGRFTRPQRTKPQRAA